MAYFNIFSLVFVLNNKLNKKSKTRKVYISLIYLNYLIALANSNLRLHRMKERREKERKTNNSKTNNKKNNIFD